MTQGYENLDKIIRSECLIQEDHNLSNYLRYLEFAKEALRDQKLDKKSEVTVILGTTSSIATLAFPDDYLQWSRIGTMEGDRIKEFIVNNKLTLYHAEVDGEEVNNDPYQPSFGFPLSNETASLYNSPLYNSSGSIYGFGNGGYINSGQFRIDEANRRFQFSSHWTETEVYLEYVGTGLHPTAATVVDGNTSKTIKLYIRWQAIETSKTATMNEKLRAEQQFNNENLKATKRGLVNLDKILGIAREAYKTTNKY
jgi:hypothetical protein